MIHSPKHTGLFQRAAVFAIASILLLNDRAYGQQYDSISLTSATQYVSAAHGGAAVSISDSAPAAPSDANNGAADNTSVSGNSSALGNSFTTNHCCEGNCCAAGNCIRDCLPGNYFSQNGWFAGAEYLYLREHMSEPVAAVQRTAGVDANGDPVTLDEAQEFSFGYNSSYRMFGGFRWGDCGESLTLGYFHYGNATDYVTDPVCPDFCHTYIGQLGNAADSVGEQFIATYRTNINAYDLDYTKRIPICSCNSNPCDCCDCPPWALSWSAGVRVLDFSRTEANAVFDNTGILATTGNILTEFVGAGPKVGLSGRWYMSDCHLWSFYSKGSAALLLGDYETTRTLTLVGLGASVQRDNYRRVVPVTEIEVGVSRQCGPNTLLTAGYFFQAYWDLGMFGSINGTNFGSQDDANILSFDGLMVRVERTF